MVKIMSAQKTNFNSHKPMTAEAVARIQSATAVKNGGQVPSGSFAARAQSTVAKSNNK